MTINTKQVTDRRVVKYADYNDFLVDAEHLAGQPVRTLGNWSQAQIYEHLALSLDSSIDGAGFLLPAPDALDHGAADEEKVPHRDHSCRVQGNPQVYPSRDYGPERRHR